MNVEKIFKLILAMIRLNWYGKLIIELEDGRISDFIIDDSRIKKDEQVEKLLAKFT